MVGMPEPQTISMTSTVCAVAGQVSRDLAGEAVILHLTSGVYYALDPVGARIWNLLQKPTSAQRLCDAILAEYDVEAQQCQKDVLALLRDLLAQGLIEVGDEMAG